jgi:uncharacterized protein (UPF0218 family)
MQTENMRSKSDNDFAVLKNTLVLPEELRDHLKDPLGEVVLQNQLRETLKDFIKVVTVGDICTLTLFEEDIVPSIAVVDYSTRRGDIGELRSKIQKIGQIVINVNNPAGVITKELWSAVDEAYKSKIPVRIEVDGEEDLATLAAVWHAPEGTAVIYGLPEVGLVVIKDLKEAKEKVRDVLTMIR